MKRWLVYLYSRAWRQRYGDEFGAVLEQQQLSAADVIDIVRGALDAHWTTFPAALRGTIVMLLTLCCTALSIRYQRLDALWCGGSLGAGFPLQFVCDSSGGSPTSSLGKIDAADIEGIVMPRLLLNVLFYMLLVLLAGRVVYGSFVLLQRARRSM